MCECGCSVLLKIPKDEMEIRELIFSEFKFNFLKDIFIQAKYTCIHL